VSKTKHIGIVAVSAEGAALCYRTICSEGTAILGPHDHPPVTMQTYSLADYMRPIYENRWDECAQLLLKSANKVIDAGAELLICPDNTIHQALELIRHETRVPWLHIAEEVAAVAAALRAGEPGAVAVVSGGNVDPEAYARYILADR